MERIIARIVGRGGRKTRYRGVDKNRAQMRMKASAENFLRMLRLGLTWHPATGWTTG